MKTYPNVYKPALLLIVSTLLTPNLSRAQNAETRPYIEIEKHDSVTNPDLNIKKDDTFSVHSNFKINNLNAKKLVSFEPYSISPSTEYEVGVEYLKTLSESFKISALVEFNRYSMPEISTTTPLIKKSEKSQASGALGLQLLFTDDNFIGLYAKYSPHYYLLQTKEGQLEIDYASSLSYQAETEYQFYKERGYIVSSHFGVDYIINSKINGNAFGFNLGFMYQQQFKSEDSLKVKLSFSQETMDSNTHNLINNSMALGFIYSLPN